MTDKYDRLVVDPATVNPQDTYKLLIGAVVPRPIAFVGSLSETGVRNLAPFSFFTIASANPPVVVVQNSVRGDGTRKDSITNIERTGEFTVNIVSEAIAEAMNTASGEYAPDVDEFDVAGLTPLPGDVVAAPRVAESLVNMECKLLQVVRVSDLPLGGSLMLGQVVRFHVASHIVSNLRIDPALLRPIGRMGGPSYVRCTDRFDMARPEVTRA